MSLDHLETIILQSSALSQLRTRYKAFLFPSHPINTVARATDPTEGLLPINVLHLESHSLDLDVIRECIGGYSAKDTPRSVFEQYYTFIQGCCGERPARLYRLSLELMFMIIRAFVPKLFNEHILNVTRTSIPGISKIAVQSVERLLRPTLKPGFERIEWTCVSDMAYYAGNQLTVDA